jgi:D-sedoheptulose 7-phosphate isomerase
MNKKATSYFKHVYDLLLSVQVTDEHGVVLSLDEAASKAVRMILSVESDSGKVMLIGNGGSAAIASHMQCDLCNSVGIRAMVFYETPLLTALSNDHGYGRAFEPPVELWANTGDLLLAISSSGQSENILRAVQAAAKRGCQIITLSGFSDDNPLRRMGLLNFYIASQDYGYVELAHSALTHFLTDCAVMSRSKAGDSRD